MTIRPAALREAIARAAQSSRLDRVINYFDPVRGEARMKARVTQAMLGGYIGGSRTRRATSEYLPTGRSANADLLPDLPVLRSRSRDMERNAPIAGGAISTVVAYVVGTGLMLQSRVNRDVLNMSDEQAAAWQTKAELEFWLWSGNADCDITRTQNFYEKQDMVLRGVLGSGDMIILLPAVKRPGNPYSLKLQAIESDRLTNPKNAMDTAMMSGGVEMDAAGAPVAYHILRDHPGDFRASRETDRYAAFGEKTGRRNVLHLFKPLRPGQNRGEPFLAPVIELVKQLDRYTEAEIMAAVVSGMFTVFTHTELGQGIDPANQQGMGKETGATSADTDVKLGNGAIVDLGLNEKVDFANPGRPNAAFDPFMMAILRQIGMRLGIPYEVLVMHFTASYSAARAALLQAWKFFSVRRYWLACNFCQPVYETFLAEAVALGRISAPGFFTDPLMRMAYCGSEWQGDGMPAIQPMQEAEAIEKRIDIGLTTLQTETAAYDGRDWEANQAQRAREQLARKAAGLLPEPKLPAAAGDAPAEDPGGPSNDYTNATVDAIAGMTNEVKALASRPAPPVNIYHGQPPQTWIFETRPDGTTRVRPEAEEDAQ